MYILREIDPGLIRPKNRLNHRTQDSCSPATVGTIFCCCACFVFAYWPIEKSAAGDSSNFQIFPRFLFLLTRGAFLRFFTVASNMAKPGVY
jgi:hypothetical protein